MIETLFSIIAAVLILGIFMLSPVLTLIFSYLAIEFVLNLIKRKGNKNDL